MSGSRVGRRDLNDSQNMLFKEFLRVINAIHPRYIEMENAEGFMDTEINNFVGINNNWG